jgi:hypothetical protein
VIDGVRLSDDDVAQVLVAMRRVAAAPQAEPDREHVSRQRRDLQEALTAGTISLPAFNRSWRALERPAPPRNVPPDELELRRARRALGDFGRLWRDGAVSDRLREEALREMVARVDIDGPNVVAVHPQPNENAWLLGYAAIKGHVGMVGARGLEPRQRHHLC